MICFVYMKFTRQQIVTLITGVLAALAVIVTLINPNAQPQADKLNQLSEQVKNLTEDVVADLPPDLTRESTFNFAGEECSDIEGSYSVKAGVPNTQGEVTLLLLSDGQGNEEAFGVLPAGLSYTAAIDSKYNRPIIAYCASKVAMGFDVWVYDARIPMADLDTRFPLYKKYYFINQIINK